MCKNRKFTKAETDVNEKIVLNHLNNLGVGHFKLADDEFEHYDIVGRWRGNPVFVEVKQRREWFPSMFIETGKIDAMKNIHAKYKDKTDKKIYFFLIMSVEGEHRVYDMQDIHNHCNTTVREMNGKSATDFNGNGNKKSKEVFLVPFNFHKFDLVTQRIGPEYEITLKDRDE